jgi:hypothetical protein
MESFLAAIAGRRGDDTTAKAQDVIYEAWERATSRSRIALARNALGISPLCADAYVLLAEEARPIEEARDYCPPQLSRPGPRNSSKSNTLHGRHRNAKVLFLAHRAGQQAMEGTVAAPTSPGGGAFYARPRSRRIINRSLYVRRNRAV